MVKLPPPEGGDISCRTRADHLGASLLTAGPHERLTLLYPEEDSQVLYREVEYENMEAKK